MESASDSHGAVVQPFDFGVRLGIVLIVESASLSALAVSALLLYILYLFVTLKRFRFSTTRRWKTSQIHYYFINLLVSDLIQALGGIIDIKWTLEAGVTEGAICTAQGILKQMGDVGVALTSLAITTHTFSVLVLRLHSRPRTVLLVIVMIWLFIVLIVAVSMAMHRRQNYYGVTQFWCWITSDFDGERIALEYVWMWFAAATHIVCYCVIALVVKGVMTVDGLRIRFRRTRSRDNISEQLSLRGEARQANTIAMQMLFYPLIYLVTVFPITIVRWLAFAGRDIPPSATIFSAILFSSSGILNVTLFLLTRPGLLPSHRRSFPAIQTSLGSTTIHNIQSPEYNMECTTDKSSRRDTPEMDGLTNLPRLHVRYMHSASEVSRPPTAATV